MEMVERVARGICEADGLDPDEHVYGNQAAGFEDFGPRWQADHRSGGQLGAVRDYVANARAAIEAMREPGDTVLREIAQRVWYSGSGVKINEAWAAAISAALAE